MARDDGATPLAPVHFARFVWGQLTSMRTALALLFVAALAAIPGSFVPQRPTAPQEVRDWIVAHPRLGPIYDRLGVFDVYASPWFAAVYLLLLVSLIGCILPRIATYARALRKPPPATPRNLARLPEHRRVQADGSAAATLDRAAAALRAKRFRVRREDDAVAAERGYLRELGNLAFHVSLVIMLLGVAWTNLFGYKGTVVVTEGQGFSNTLTQYDDFSAGAAFKGGQLEPFTVSLDKFTARFETGPVQTGAAREFRADVRVRTAQGEQQRVLEVNHPLDINSTTVHLSGHGYSAVVTVKDGNGDVAFSGPVVFLPQDSNLRSYGVIKVPDGRPQRLAFEGFFLPTAVVDAGGPRSLFPDAYNPELFLNAWGGPPAAETGRAENVYSLNTAGLTQLKQANGDVVRFRIKPGETFQLPEGQGSIQFQGWQRWTKLQVSHKPGMWLTLSSVLLGVAGLCLSLFVRPRRLWVRVQGDGTADVAGLDRADARLGLAEDVTWLAGVVGPAAMDADTDEETDA